MERSFNHQQQDFVAAMGKGFRDHNDTIALQFVLFGIGIFFLLVAVISLTYKYRYWFKGRWIYFMRAIHGKAHPKFRSKKGYEVLLLEQVGGDKLYRTRTVNLSQSGMFLKVNPPMPKGKKFKFILYLPSRPRINGMAEVMWVQENWSEHHPTGNGCRFIAIDDRDRVAIRAATR